MTTHFTTKSLSVVMGPRLRGDDGKTRSFHAVASENSAF